MAGIGPGVGAMRSLVSADVEFVRDVIVKSHFLTKCPVY